MLRTLIARRVFTALNVALLILLVLTLGGRLVSGFVGTDESALVGPDLGDAEQNKVYITPVKTRSAYDGIVKSALFVPDPPKTATPKPKKKPPRPPVKKDVDSTLPLRLIGTVYSGGNDLAATAIIENRSGTPVKKSYYLDEAVMDGVYLRKVLRKEVVLENTKKNRMEHLRLEKSRTQFKSVTRPTSRRATPTASPRRSSVRKTPTPTATRSFTFRKGEIATELTDNYADIASKVDVRIVRNAEGQIEGIQANNLSAVPIAKRLGFEDNDILSSVNGHKIESLDDIYEVIEKSNGSSAALVTFVRNGQTFQYRYNFNR